MVSIFAGINHSVNILIIAIAIMLISDRDEINQELQASKKDNHTHEKKRKR